MILLTRDEFRRQALERDKNKCVFCKSDAVDVHHIIERKLFDDGGYYLNNAASLCSKCHLLAEQTLISPQELYTLLGVQRKLPDHFHPQYEYTKWGDIEKKNYRIPGELFHEESVQKLLQEAGVFSRYYPYIKYPRTYHLPWSPNLQNDDKGLENCDQFVGQEVIITEKLDGENTTAYYNGHVHARALESNYHESRNWVKSFLVPKTGDLPFGWRICGENVYAKHSIHYKRLKSYFYLFSIWNEKNICLSWDETLEWADLLELQTVHIYYRGEWDEQKAKFIADVESKVSDNIKNNIHPHKEDEIEGYVVRNTKSFPYRDFRRNTAKYVRKNHVQTSQHWMTEKVIKNELVQP